MKIIQHKTRLRSDSQYSLLKFMLMNELVRMKLFNLLSETSQITNEEMQSAYECFMGQLGAVSQSGNDYSEVFRTLNITRVELVFMESLYWHEEGKKCA